MKANTTEASTVVKLSPREGKHNIKIIVGNAVAEAEIIVVDGSVGLALAVAAVVGVTVIGVVLFLLQKPREIALLTLHVFHRAVAAVASYLDV